MIETLTATLPDGAKLPVSAYAAGAPLPTNAGVYFFLRKDVLGWSILYIGEALNLDERSGKGLNCHEKKAAAVRLGISHVGVIALVPTAANSRFELEKRLCRAFQPPLNKLLVR